MPQNYLSRVLIVLAVLYIGLFGFFPFSADQGVFNVPALFHSHSWAQRTNIKPGIDIAGGISLVYEIKTPPNASPSSDLPEAVATNLKKRVDPDGVRGLIWRPEGTNRLEIQLPRSSASDEVRTVRQEYLKAQQEVDHLNVRPEAVLDAVQMPPGAQRDQRINDLAAGSATRLKTYHEMAEANDTMQAAVAQSAAAKAKGDSVAQNAADDRWARAKAKFDDLRAKLDQTNLSTKELEAFLDTSSLTLKEKDLAELHSKNADFPRRLAAIDNYQKAYASYKNLHGAIDDSAELKALLRGSGVLEFHILADDTTLPSDVQDMVKRLQLQGPVPQGGDRLRWYQADRADEFPVGKQAGYPQDYNGKRYVLASVEPGDSMVHKQGATPWALTQAFPDTNQAGQQCVGFEFDAEGANLFGKLTSTHVPAGTHKFCLAIVLDDKLVSAPTINSEIGARGIIEGGRAGYSNSELKYLVNTLNAGSLPAQLADEPISERIISPQLGVVNLQKGLYASFIGLAVVAVFLIGYYYFAGLIAFFAVVMNLIIILGVLATFRATFTLPSIAGIVLTVGTAVDANVLVFERLREEQHRGLSLKMALGNAYAKAWHAIIDSNMTTVITSVFLYFIGSEEVKGFGLTLLIGIGSSLFTSVFVTKTIFGIMTTKYGLKDLTSLPRTFPRWDRLLRPNIDWMGLIWPFIIFSTVFIVSGMTSFVMDARNMFDIEFASGTSVQFDLKKDSPMTREQVVDAINVQNSKAPDPKHPPIPVASVVAINVGAGAVGDRALSYEVVTPNEDKNQVCAAILASALGPHIDVKLPSTFTNCVTIGEDSKPRPTKAVEVMGKEIIGVPPKGPLSIGGINIPDAPDHPGGVAIILRNLEPAISPNEIQIRIRDASVEPGFENTTKGWSSIDVDRLDNNTSPDAVNQPCFAAVVLVSDPKFPREKDPAAWIANVADPLWTLIQHGVNKTAQLQKISNFNPQVAADARINATLATILSIFFIMAYIWFRFGNLKYGTATVVALIHDTLATIGAIGLSHFIANTGVGNTLLLEPFRINLTLVAAILTVMSYSMIDTIVVFDRIREIRGKYGHISRGVINDGINQTLSRTLLTCGITIIMVATMYICGGPGIHGFTFVLLIGILVGTYSSIAIAAPILLIGSGKTAAGRGTGPGQSRSSPAIVPQRVGVLDKAR